MAYWVQDPEAVKLLDALVKNRIEKQPKTYRFNEVRFEYSGKLVRELRAIRTRYLELTLAACDRCRDYTAFREECAVTVDDAIDAAYERATETPVEQHVRLRRAKPAQKVAA